MSTAQYLVILFFLPFTLFAQIEVNPYVFVNMNGNWAGSYSYLDKFTSKPKNIECEGILEVNFSERKISWIKKFSDMAYSVTESIPFTDYTFNNDPVTFFDKKDDYWILITERNSDDLNFQMQRFTYTFNKDLLIVREDRLKSGQEGWQIHSEYLMDKNTSLE